MSTVKPIYGPNTKQWRKGDLVLADSDAKEPKMLMKVIGYTRDGLCKTQYVFKDRKRTIWKNEICYLHDPEQWIMGSSRWENHTQEILQKYQERFLRVRRWNKKYKVGQRVRTTSADGGFITETGGEAKFEHGSDHIWLLRREDGRGGWWSLEFVEPVTD